MTALHANLTAQWIWMNSDEKRRPRHFDPPIDIPGPRSQTSETVQVAGVARESADQWLAERRARQLARSSA